MNSVELTQNGEKFERGIGSLGSISHRALVSYEFH